MIKQRYLNFQKDLQEGMTLTEALQKHNITLEDAFNTLHFSKPPEPTNEKRKTMRNVDFYIFKRKNSYTIRKHVDGKQRVFGTYEKLEDAIKVRDWLIRADWKIDDLDELCKKLKVKRRKGR